MARTQTQLNRKAEIKRMRIARKARSPYATSPFDCLGSLGRQISDGMGSTQRKASAIATRFRLPLTLVERVMHGCGRFLFSKQTRLFRVG